MIRALAKGAVLFAFGRIPGGATLYRYITRTRMGTQSTHVDKLSRVWPGYVKVWREKCGLELDGKTLWIHEGGFTPMPFLMSYLLTGRGGVVTNCDATVLARYFEKAFDAALSTGYDVRDDRCEVLRGLRGAPLEDVLQAIGGELHEHIDPSRLPIVEESADLVHSGGTLEHYSPPKLRAFISESFRVLRSGGVASHVFDMRDHLYHADKRYPFLKHLSFGDASYGLLFGHRLLYHNRLLPREVADMFRAAGFDIICLRRLLLPESRYIMDGEPFFGSLAGIERARLARRFSKATDADLHTAACHFLLRKP